MRSNLLSRHDLLSSEDFVKDIKATFELEPDILAKLPEYAFKAVEAPTKAESDQAYEAAAKRFSMAKGKLAHAIDIGRFFLIHFSPKGEAESDKPEDLAYDLAEQFKLPKNKTETIETFLSNLKTLAKEKIKYKLIKRARAESTLPNLEGVSVSADFRAVFDESYKYEEDISSFLPHLLDVVPVGIIRLKLTQESETGVFFQVTNRSLQVLIDNLVALQKQIAIADKRIVIKEK